MKFFREHPRYSFRSLEKTLIKIGNIKLTVTEYYFPHTIHFNLWIKDNDKTSDLKMYILKNWYHLPLDKESYLIQKSIKLEEKATKTKNKLEILYKKRQQQAVKEV